LPRSVRVKNINPLSSEIFVFSDLRYNFINLTVVPDEYEQLKCYGAGTLLTKNKWWSGVWTRLYWKISEGRKLLQCPLLLALSKYEFWNNRTFYR